MSEGQDKKMGMLCTPPVGGCEFTQCSSWLWAAPKQSGKRSRPKP